MASKSVLIVALLFSVPILFLQGTYAYASASASASDSASASASAAIEGGFGNGDWDSQGYGDDEEHTATPRKKRFEWKKSLHEKFMLAITQIGLHKATPTKILEVMNEPHLTYYRVASHWQKYKIFLDQLQVAVAAGDEDSRERLRRSSFALGHLELLSNNNERDQQQMGTSIGSTFQPSAGIGSTLPLTTPASNSHGTIQFSNDQQSSTSDASRSIPQLIGSGQSSLLNNNPANFLRQQPTLGNRNGDQLFCQENCPAAFGMQQPSNNFENGGNLGPHDISMMLLTDEQDNYQPPSQQQDGGHDQLPYQVEVPDPAANQVPNLSADQVPNPGPYHVAPNETILEPGMPTLEDDNTWFSYLSEDIWDADIWWDVVDIWDADT